MRIVVNHLTRMKRDARICVAGVEPGSRAAVRPVTPRFEPIGRELLHENGGPFEVGALVDLGDTTPAPTAPETEDHRFRIENARLLELLEPDEYWELLEAIQDESIETAFGRELRQRGSGYAIDAGRGLRSLAVVRAPDGLSLAINHWGNLRLSFEGISLSVGDVRFVEPDHETLREDVVADVGRRLADGVDAFLMLGLPRAFVANGDDAHRHWLQINGLCLADRPVGSVP